MGRKQSEYRKKGRRKEGFSSVDEGFQSIEETLGKDVETKMVSLLNEEGKQKHIKRVDRRQNYQKGGNKMYGRPLRPEDARSIALREAAEAVVEAKLEGEKSDKYIKAKDAFNKLLGIQRIKSPPRFPIRETLNTAYEVQKLVIEGKINRNVLFLIANTLRKPHLGYTAVAISNVRQTLLDKEVDLVKERITNRADYQNIERLLEVLTANGLKRERLYLAEKVSREVIPKIEARIARRLILDRKPELVEQLPELPLDRKVELTKEYVGKVLGGLQAIGNSSQYSVLTDVVPESWRRPVKLTVPKKEKVEAPLETVEKKDVVKEKSKPTVKVKEDKEPVKDKVVEDIGKETPAPVAKDKEHAIDDDTLVEKLELPVGALKALKKENLNTVGDLKKARLERIKEVKGLGKKSLGILIPLLK